MLGTSLVDQTQLAEPPLTTRFRCASFFCVGFSFFRKKEKLSEITAVHWTSVGENIRPSETSGSDLDEAAVRAGEGV